jgi:hypothetical protein
VNEGFFLEPAQAARMIHANSRNLEVLFPYMIGRDLVEDYRPTRWIIDFAQRDQFEARSYEEPWRHVEENVMPQVIARAEKEKRDTGKDKTRWSRMAKRWWQFRDYMPGTMSAIAPLPRYIMCPRVTKRPIFEFISTQIHPDGATMVFPFSDDYSFGMLQSGIHFLWFRAKCSTLKGDFRYTSDTVFETFPWPQNPTNHQTRAVADAAVALRKLRHETMDKLKFSLRQLYRTLEQPGDNPMREAQARLDATVRAAYGMPDKADPLAFLLDLNLACAAKEKAGDKITPPGLSLPTLEQSIFVTDDCIRSESHPREQL